MPDVAPLESDRRVDIVVVGAGIAGLLTAARLADAGSDVLVLDRHRLGGVATRNTTAKITALQGTVYRTIRDARGPEAAEHYGAAQLEAVDGLGRLVAELDIDCRFTRAPAYTYATEPEAADPLREELVAAEAAGIPVEWVDDTELPFAVLGAVRLDHQAHFDPERFCAGLARAIGTEHLADDCTVVDVDESDDGCVVRTAGGPTVRADHVVIATQAPIVDPQLLANRCEPVQSYGIALRTDEAHPRGMYLSSDEAVRSLRPAVIDDQPALVIGGEGHRMGAPSATAARWDTLIEWGAEHFGSGTVVHRWATHDLVPTDHVPFIGRLASGAHRRWVATGFAKWGMTNAYVASELITAGIHGRTIPWCEPFDATRVRASVNRELLSAAGTATRHLLADRIARRPEPRCSHQGCVLRRDDALDTWDCPCHGSRFDASGRVVQGPATADISVNHGDAAATE
jgi:glycine/D-amino acid oxidase-like deaminating enzyme